MTDNYLKYGRKYYEKNRDRVIRHAGVSNKRGNIRNQRYVWEYLKDKKCVLCGDGYTLHLTFDHNGNEKLKEVSTMSKQAYGLETIKAEIAKCRILCFNCHMVETNRLNNSLKWQWTTALRAA
jgi:hypothetical protein